MKSSAAWFSRMRSGWNENFLLALGVVSLLLLLKENFLRNLGVLRPSVFWCLNDCAFASLIGFLLVDGLWFAK